VKQAVIATIVGQFGHPRGTAGRVAGWVMAYRPSNRQRNRWVVWLLEVQPTDRVLEIGFGPGLTIAELARRVGHQGHVYGIDHSQVMLHQATSRNAAAIAAGRVSLHRGLGRSAAAFAGWSVRRHPGRQLPGVLAGTDPATPRAPPTTPTLRSHRHRLPTPLPRGHRQHLPRCRPQDPSAAPGRRLHHDQDRDPGAGPSRGLHPRRQPRPCWRPQLASSRPHTLRPVQPRGYPAA
jgi:Methyltransferase domain